MRFESRRGSIFWVTANEQGKPARSLSRSNVRRYLVTPGEPGAHAAFRVAGCSGIALGRASRRAA